MLTILVPLFFLNILLFFFLAASRSMGHLSFRVFFFFLYLVEGSNWSACYGSWKNQLTTLKKLFCVKGGSRRESWPLNSFKRMNESVHTLDKTLQQALVIRIPLGLREGEDPLSESLFLSFSCKRRYHKKQVEKCHEGPGSAPACLVTQRLQVDAMEAKEAKTKLNF